MSLDLSAQTQHSNKTTHKTVALLALNSRFLIADVQTNSLN